MQQDISNERYIELLEESKKELEKSQKYFRSPSYIPSAKALRLSEINRIIDYPNSDNLDININDEINTEGYSRLEDGSLYICVHTPLDYCSGSMVNWWFQYVDNTAKYILWHPVDHVSGTWNEEYLMKNVLDRTYIGNSHIVDEYVGGKLNRVHIDFQPSRKYFKGNDDPMTCDNMDYKFKKNGITSCIMGRINIYDPLLGDIAVGHLCHMVIENNKDKPHKCKMISRFWLGDISSNVGSKHYSRRNRSSTEEVTSVQSVNIFGHGLISRLLSATFIDLIGNSKIGRYLKASNQLGIDVYKHCYEEMRCLNKILPQLHKDWEHRNKNI